MLEQNKTQSILESNGYLVINSMEPSSSKDILLAHRVNERIVLAGIAEVSHVDDINGEYVVPLTKIRCGAMAAGCLQVPFYIIVRVKDNVLIWRMTDKNGNYIEQFVVCESRTTIRKYVHLSLESKYLTIVN
jgi:hypothetical protein